MNEALLKVENISKSFGQKEIAVKAARNIFLEVGRGEIVLIMGPSGSGKTTLLTIMGSLLRPDSGKVLLGGEDLTGLSGNKLASTRSHRIGFVFQAFNLLKSLNVMENVAVVLELIGVRGSEAKERAEKLLSSLGLGERLNYRISDLSGGEKQRVSIARALIADPEVILADEPTANLDSVSGHKVMELIKKVAKESHKAVVIVSHDMRIMDIADRVLWLEDGAIKEGDEHLVTDPICKMPLQQKTAPFNLKHNNRTYYFCSKKCESDFKEKNNINV